METQEHQSAERRVADLERKLQVYQDDMATLRERLVAVEHVATLWQRKLAHETFAKQQVRSLEARHNEGE